MFFFHHAVTPPEIPHGQRGFVLIIALTFLGVLTMMALVASDRSLLEARMTNSLRDAQLAQMSAETALRGVEWMLWVNSNDPEAEPLSCDSGVLAGKCYAYNPNNREFYGPEGIVTVFRSSVAWIDKGATVYRGASGNIDYTAPPQGEETAKLARNPVYMIEDLGTSASPERHIYRITVHAVGSTNRSIRVMESTFYVKSAH